MCLVALISGISGQDGSYLADLLLTKNYYIWGMIRKSSSTIKVQNISHLLNNPRITLKYADLSDGARLMQLLLEIKAMYPDLTRLEVYNLGALSHVKISFEIPEYAGDINGLGTLRFLEAIRLCGYSNKIRFYQASTSELFGKVLEIPQDEKTPFYPRSPYAVAKMYAFWTVKNYREAYGLHASNGILFNHESPRRDEIFVTRKITKGLGDIIHGRADKLVLGNINARRDWGHARDYVYGMWLMVQHNEPDDFVLCSNETHSVREFIELSFSLKGYNIKWKGEDIDEIGYDEKTGRELIFIDKNLFRPTEVDMLIGDCSKANKILNWYPVIKFKELVEEMVEHDC